MRAICHFKNYKLVKKDSGPIMYLVSQSLIWPCGVQAFV